MTTMVALDHADMAARVARQPRVGLGVDVFGAHPIARFEFCRPGRSTAELAAHHDALDIIELELAVLERLCRFYRMPRRDILGRDKTLVDQQVLEPEQPFLVIGT